MDSKHFNALVSPDAYEYLDEPECDDLLKEDDLLMEQEEAENSDIYDDEDDELVQEDTDDSDMYQYNSLFDELDEEDSFEESSMTEEEISENKSELMLEDDEDDGISVLRDESENINEMINAITMKLPKYNAVSGYLKKLPRIMQDQLADIIARVFTVWKTEKRDKMFEIPNTGISIAVMGKSSDPMVQIQRMENIGAVMVANEKSHWSALFIYLNNLAEIESVECRELSRQSFSDWEWKTVLDMGEKIKARKK